MKQRTTGEELDKLNEKGKKKLYKWWIENHHKRLDFANGCQWNKPVGGNLVETYYLPYLTIGQMIEFLGREKANEALTTYMMGNPGGPYLVELDKICDRLWEEVKEALQGEEE